MFRKLLVANRGEIARRIFRACRRLGVKTVAVYSEADRDAAHVGDADEAVAIGPAPARQSYLNVGAIIAAARERGAEAVHPGYGFLSENWRFAAACADAGLVFVGPPSEVIRSMADKTEARRLMQVPGEPLPWRQDDAVVRGAALECRVYAEDPARGFLPSPGTVTRLALPSGEGIRVESGVVEGSHVPVHYDPLLMQLIARGDSRSEALARMAGALDACVVEEVRTTLPFLRRVLRHPEFRRGSVHVQMVEQGAFNA